MEITKVGFRFDPTDVELVDYYLKNKIIGKEWLVHDTIGEVNVCNYDPAALPGLSLIKSKDNVWYFISSKEFTSRKKVSRRRSTPSGFWKPTGRDRKVKRNRAVIGTKRTLTYHASNTSSGIWTIHEYEVTSLTLADQVEQAGEESLSYFNVNDVTMIMNDPEEICLWDVLGPAPNTLSTVDNNPNGQLPDDGEFLGALAHVNREDVEFLFTDDQEPITQESCDEYLLNWLY